MLFTLQTMLGKPKRLIESFWVKSSNCEQTAPSTFTNHFESKRTCWTIISNREL